MLQTCGIATMARTMPGTMTVDSRDPVCCTNSLHSLYSCEVRFQGGREHTNLPAGTRCCCLLSLNQMRPHTTLSCSGSQARSCQRDRRRSGILERPGLHSHRQLQGWHCSKYRMCFVVADTCAVHTLPIVHRCMATKLCFEEASQ